MRTDWLYHLARREHSLRREALRICLPQANEDVKLTLQSYNFGGGFIDYVQENGGRYTKQLAISFSQMMYQRVKKSGIYQCHRPSAIEHQACYGDIEYVDAFSDI